MQTKILAFAAALLAGAPAAAQQPAPVSLQLEVRPTVEALPGGVVRVSYVVANLASSADSLWSFTVDAPAPPLAIRAPDAERWEVATLDHDAPVAGWGILEGMIGPGQASPALVFEAAGLPDVVQFRAVRYFPVPDGDQGEPDPSDAAAAAAPDPLASETVTGSTVGVVPPPAAATPDELAARLRQLTDRACALGWIDNHGVCNSLRTKAVADAAQLRAMLNELGAQRGKHVSESGYALLAANAEYLSGRL